MSTEPSNQAENLQVSTGRAKRTFSALTMEEAIRLVPAEDLLSWDLTTPPRPPSTVLLDTLHRLESFELFSSEAAKVMLTDVILAEIVPEYLQLKVWKSAPLDSPTVSGVADYLIAPKRAYIKTTLRWGRYSAWRRWQSVSRTTDATGRIPRCMASFQMDRAGSSTG